MALFLVALSIDAEHNYYASHMYIVTYEYGKVRSNLYRNLQGLKSKYVTIAIFCRMPIYQYNLK